MIYINFNGKILEEPTPLIGAGNRGLRYGDGLFETIKYKNDQLLFLDEHLSRLWKGMQLLQFEIPKLFTPDLLQEQILRLLKKNNHSSARVRLTVIRGNGGLYDCNNHTPIYLIESWPLSENNNRLNENGLQLCIYRNSVKAIDDFSNLKHNNYLPYFMGALFAKQQRCNDAILLNQQQRICDSTIANIFMISNQKIFTPSLTEGCVAGVMRKFIISELSRSGNPVTESSVTEMAILDADEVFLTNSMYNIRWVASIENKQYQNNITREIFSKLQQTNLALFC